MHPIFFKITSEARFPILQHSSNLLPCIYPAIKPAKKESPAPLVSTISLFGILEGKLFKIKSILFLL